MVNCPKCGKEMRFIDQYGRWYCDSCGEYAPKGYGEKDSGTPLCSSCGRPLTYIKEYGRWYCYSCKEYAPKDIPPPATYPAPEKVEPAASAPAMPASVPVTSARPASAPAVKRVPSHSHAGNPATGGWLMLLGLLLVLTDEIMYILLATGSLLIIPPLVGGALPVYGAGLGSMLGITGLLLFMVGGVVAALAARVK
jgi:predicted RNA-binding Zn-ribbon protein involved in translation (DUF1610 family)